MEPKGNSYKKNYEIDEFGRRYYLKRTARSLIRSDKKRSRKKNRQLAKKEIVEEKEVEE